MGNTYKYITGTGLKYSDVQEKIKKYNNKIQEATSNFDEKSITDELEKIEKKLDELEKCWSTDNGEKSLKLAKSEFSTIKSQMNKFIYKAKQTKKLKLEAAQPKEIVTELRKVL